MISEATLRDLLTTTVRSTDLPFAGTKSVGKVRDSYVVGDLRALVTTDRISAFDVVLGTVPLKGQVLNRMAAHWFEATKGIAPNHLVGAPDPNVTLAVQCDPIPVEFVMRGYLTGVTSTSVWTHYSAGARTFCGHALPDGLRKNEPLPVPILTPSTKSSGGEHDVSVSREEIIACGTVSARDFDECAQMARDLFAFGQQEAAKRGLILVDTKYEFGIARGGRHHGRVVVMDEMHTPDSSRYWFAHSYKTCLSDGREPHSLDKEFVRRWCVDNGWRGDGEPPPLPDDVRVEAAKRYVEAFERITGLDFSTVANLEEPGARMRRNLGFR